MQVPVFVAVLSCSAAGLSAGEKPKWKADAARGLKLSKTLCASCHFVDGNSSKQTVAGVPTFRAIKDLPDQHIRGILIRPHKPMPNTQLTRNEIADILAYMDELRRKARGAPDEPEKKLRPKPTYPSPS
ncbi:MAG: c-type cytochrome [Hyphomicrobiaceae bacterium]